MKKRIWALLLILCMVMSLLSVTAWAEDPTCSGEEASCTADVHVSTCPLAKVELTHSGTTTYYETLAKAIATAASGDTIVLLTNVQETLPVQTVATLTIDLGGKTLTLDNTSSITLSDGKSLTIQNGKIVMDHRISNDGTYALFNINTNCSIKLDSVEVDSKATVLYPQGDAAKVEVVDSTIKCGVYAVGTNAATVDNYNVVISLENSTFSSGGSNYGWRGDMDSCVILINVAGTLNMENCKVTGTRQGVVVRAGTATIKDCEIKTTGQYGSYNDYYTGDWKSGDEVPAAGLVVGSHNGSYLANASVTMENTTVSADNDYAAIYMDANATYSSSLTISGDDSSVGKIVKTDAEKATLLIKGGTFSSQIDAAYLDKDYVCEKSGSDYIVYAPATSLKINENDAEVPYAANKTIQLTTTTTPAKITHSITWASDNTDVATVSSTGKVTIKQAGTAKITASVDGQEATYNLTVTKASLSTLKVTPSATSLVGGGTVTLTVETDPTDAVIEVTCDDGITVTNKGNGTYTATLRNADASYAFTVAVAETDPHYQGSAVINVKVTRYIADTASTSTKTTTTTQTTVTAAVADTQVADDVVSLTTVTDAATGTVTTTTEKADGSTKVVEAKTDGTVTTTATAANGVQAVTVAAPGKQVTAAVTIPETVQSAVVTIPVSGELTAGMVAMDADTGEIIMLSALTEDGLALKLDSSRNIVIVDNSKSFDDVPADNWAADGVAYATAHNLFNGTSEDSFDPDGDMTRTMLMTVLARFDGVDTSTGSTWDEAGMNWAIEQGITDGSNPDGAITREQLTTMLYRYAGSPEVDSEISGYPDADNISTYAADAMAWAVSQGIITGNTKGELNPTTNSTRSQVATMLMRFGQAQVQ
jgi:hypothetical protein